MNAVLAAIALGSNLGDRGESIRCALEQVADIPGTTLVRASPVVETAPVGSADEDLGGAYLNAAAVVETTCGPRELLKELLEIEHRLGRKRRPDARNAPRTIDLDLILYADQIIREPGLEIPHPRMHLRRFVLDPLAHIAPDWVVPTLGRTVAELFIALPLDPPANNPP